MKKPYFKIAGRAASETINLVVVGSSAVVAAALHSWPVLAIGGATYLALVGWDMVNPSYWKKVLGAPPPEVTDPEAKKILAAILAAQAEVKKVFAETPSDVVSLLTATFGGADELLRHCTGLIDHAEDISRHLQKYDVPALKAEISRLESQIASTKDAAARASYQETRAVRSEQLSTIGDLVQARERAFAQLGRALATFEGLPAKIVRMRVLDREAQDRVSGDLNAEIERVNSDVRTFEETIRVLVEPL